MDVDAQRETAIEKGFDPMSLYNPNLNAVSEPVRSYLEKQGNIPVDQILDHVRELVSPSSSFIRMVLAELD
jgi:hypothetical protein